MPRVSRFDDPGRCLVISLVNSWFAGAARDLPWRAPGTSAWGVLVSEFMSQQTPVARVIGPWREWMHRWPTPAALAQATTGEAVLAWGRLGYPRRALRLHAAAEAIVEGHGGVVPSDLQALLGLPGVGEYTAGAVLCFAFGRRALVLDTNVRRVLARIETGVQYPANATTAAERRLAAQWLPGDDATASRWAAASMELGALVCTASSPDCSSCPVADHCRWAAAGYPAHDGPPRRRQTYAGTDRQARGRLLEVLRHSEVGVDEQTLLGAWASDTAQARRALDGLLDDGLAHRQANMIIL